MRRRLLLSRKTDTVRTTTVIVAVGNKLEFRKVSASVVGSALELAFI
jgi:hypothetical protein